MPTPIVPKKSTQSGKVPGVGDLALGEIAINHADGRLYARHPSTGTVAQIAATATHTHPLSDLTQSNATAGQVIAWNSTLNQWTAQNAPVGTNGVINGGGASTLRALTQAQYNAITSPDANTVYIITA